MTLDNARFHQWLNNYGTPTDYGTSGLAPIAEDVTTDVLGNPMPGQYNFSDIYAAGPGDGAGQWPAGAETPHRHPVQRRAMAMAMAAEAEDAGHSLEPTPEMIANAASSQERDAATVMPAFSENVEMADPIATPQVPGQMGKAKKGRAAGTVAPSPISKAGRAKKHPVAVLGPSSVEPRRSERATRK